MGQVQKKLQFWLRLYVLGFIFSSAAWASGFTPAPPAPRNAISTDQAKFLPSLSNRAEVIKNLKAIQAHQVQEIEDLDKQLRKKMSETQDVRVKESGGSDASNLTLTRVNHLTQTLQKLEATRQELILRRRFTDQLIFSIDTKWKDAPLQVFLEKQFLDMALNEMNDTTPSDGPSNLWKFYTYLSVAIRELPEPREDLVAFIEGYVNYSTISTPKAPNLYVEERSYSNGSTSQAAHQIGREDLGDGLETRLRAEGLSKPPTATLSRRASDVELRMRSTVKTPAGDEGVLSGSTLPVPDNSPVPTPMHAPSS